MKKTKVILIIAIFFVSIIIFESCRSNKKPCPAYEKVKIENIKIL